MGLLNKIGKIITAPAKVISNIVQKNPIVSAAEKVLPTKVKEAIAGITPLKGAIAGITPGGVKAAIAGITPLVKGPIAGVGGPLKGAIAGRPPLKAPIAGITPLKAATAGGPPLKAPIADARTLLNKRAYLKKGGTVKMAKGGSASSRADGIAQRGKTRGRMV